MIMLGSIITDFFSELTSSGNSFISFIGQLIESVFNLIYVDAVTDGGVTTPAHFTKLGLFVIISVVVTIVAIVISKVTSIIKLHR